jgi:hypothetical protein
VTSFGSNTGGSLSFESGLTQRPGSAPGEKLEPPSCRDCGKTLNPVAVLVGPACGACVRARHAAVVHGHPGDAAEAMTRARRAWERTSQQLSLIEE